MKTAETPKIAFRRWSEDGAPVLLVMGLGMRGDVWRPQAERLAGRYAVTTYDNRGIGGSESGPVSIEAMAGDGLRVMDAMGWPSAHVVGVSMGGMIAQELALAAPERVRSLTLISTFAGGLRTFLSPPLEGLRAFLSVNLSPPSERYGALATLLYPPSFLRTVDVGAMTQRMAEQVGERAPASVRRAQLLAVSRHDTRARLASLSMPKMVVVSGADALVAPRHQRALVRHARPDRVVTYDAAGHGVIFQCATALAGELSRFIDSAEAGPPVDAGGAPLRA